MNSIFPARGCIYAHNTGGGGGTGFYALNPPIGGSASSPILLLGAALNDDDIVLPKSTLDNLKILYSFGQGFGQVQINGMALLGSVTDGAGKGFADAVNYFQKHRVSSSKKPIQLSLPGKVAYSVSLTGLAVGQTDPQFHTQQFMFGGVIAGPPK